MLKECKKVCSGRCGKVLWGVGKGEGKCGEVCWGVGMWEVLAVGKVWVNELGCGGDVGRSEKVFEEM